MIKILPATMLLFCNWCTSALLTSIPEEAMQKLPPIFKIDPYDNCSYYCKYSLKVLPLDQENVSVHWATIEETINHPDYYKHDELYYAICMDSYNFTAHIPPKQLISNLYNEQFKPLGLRVNISHYDCNTNNVLEIQNFDVFCIYVLVIYAIFSIYATFITKQTNKFITAFSIMKNWNELRTRHKKFDNLKCIEGIRFYTMTGIILCHTYLSFSWGYTENTNYFEELPQNPIKHGLRNLFVLLVQAFFLISAWLLSYQVFQYWEENGKIDSKFLLLSLVNRYFRLLPNVLIVTGLASSVWYYRWITGPIKDLADREYYKCQKLWWANFFYINNYYRVNEICFPVFWSLGADFQLYTLSLIILATICFWKKPVMKTLLFLIFISLFICSLCSYFYDLDVILQLGPKNFKLDTFEMKMIYNSTHSNMATYILGLVFGYIYYKVQNKNIFKNQVTQYLWWFLAMMLPLIALALSIGKYNTPLKVLLAGVFKPMYALGVGLAILGMSQNSGRFFKKIFENPAVVFLGNITFGAYASHMSIVGYQVVTAKNVLFLSDYILIVSFLKYLIITYFIGLILHILVEVPGIKLQKLIIPQIYIKNKKIN